MRLTPWRKHAELSEVPGSSMRSFRDEMDRLFDSFFGMSPWSQSPRSGGSGGWSPDLDIRESDKEFVIRAEIPGLDPKDVDIRVTGNVLTMSGEKKEESEENQEGMYRTERRYGSFFRSIELPAETKPSDVSAEYDKGVLVLHIPKDEKAAPRKIEVKPSAAASEKKVDVKQEIPPET